VELVLGAGPILPVFGIEVSDDGTSVGIVGIAGQGERGRGPRVVEGGGGRQRAEAVLRQQTLRPPRVAGRKVGIGVDR
jgi:hypothetical protein